MLVCVVVERVALLSCVRNEPDHTPNEVGPGVPMWNVTPPSVERMSRDDLLYFCARSTPEEELIVISLPPVGTICQTSLTDATADATRSPEAFKIRVDVVEVTPPDDEDASMVEICT